MAVMTRPALALLLILGITAPAVAATYVVSSTAPAGPGTLDQAISDANASPGHDTIVFAVGSGSVVISYSGRPIVDDVTIDGRTQPGFAGEPLIVIQNATGTCLTVNATNRAMSEIFALALRDCGFYGLQASSPVTLKGTHLRGTGAFSGQGNSSGVRLSPGASGSIIGGTSPTDRNVIGGYIEGIRLQGDAATPVTDVTIQGNYVGLDATGTAATPNQVGITTNLSERILIGGTTPGARNVVSGNTFGLFLGGAQITVAGNYIGTSASGLSAIPNAQGGLQVSSSSSTVGGNDVAARNVVSGNGDVGLIVAGQDVQVTNNFVGVDATGMSALPNRYAGIFVGRNADQIDIGRAGAGNVISGTSELFPGEGDGWGILVLAVTGSTRIRGNIIGLNAAGTAPLPNFADGINFTSAHVTIGGSAAGDGNRIESNRGSGIWAESDGNLNGMRIEGNSIRNNLRDGILITGRAEISISGNSIFGNGKLGIDLFGAGITPNDVSDADDGANGLQNFPNLTSATLGATTSIAGTLESTPSTAFTIEFFASSQADPSTFGEGATFLGSTNVTTNAAGTASFVFAAPARAVGEVITATATGPRGTSEFSRAVTVTSPAGIPTLSPLTMLLLAAMLAGIAALSIMRS